MRGKQQTSQNIYAALLHYADQAKKLKTINSLVSTLYYIIHGHLESFIKNSTEIKNGATGESLHVKYTAMFKQASAFFDDAELLINNLAICIPEIKSYMGKYWPKDLPNFCAVQGLNEGKKWENIIATMDHLKTTHKLLSHRKKINCTLKNALLSSKLFQMYERCERQIALVYLAL